MSYSPMQQNKIRNTKEIFWKITLHSNVIGHPYLLISLMLIQSSFSFFFVCVFVCFCFCFVLFCLYLVFYDVFSTVLFINAFYSHCVRELSPFPVLTISDASNASNLSFCFNTLMSRHMCNNINTIQSYVHSQESY